MMVRIVNIKGLNKVQSDVVDMMAASIAKKLGLTIPRQTEVQADILHFLIDNDLLFVERKKR